MAVCTVLIGGVIGTAAGALTGYYGGVLDNVLMRVGDMIMSFPSVLLALILSAFWDLENIILSWLWELFLSRYLPEWCEAR